MPPVSSKLRRTILAKDRGKTKRGVAKPNKTGKRRGKGGETDLAGALRQQRKKNRMGNRGEDNLHEWCVNYVRTTYPDAVYCGSLAGIPLHSGVAKRMVKKLGYYKDSNDFNLFVRRRGWGYIAFEFKNGRKGVVRPGQRRYLQKLIKQKIYACVIRSRQQFRETVDCYMNGKVPVPSLSTEDEALDCCEMLSGFISRQPDPPRALERLVQKIRGFVAGEGGSGPVLPLQFEEEEEEEGEREERRTESDDGNEIEEIEDEDNDEVEEIEDDGDGRPCRAFSVRTVLQCLDDIPEGENDVEIDDYGEEEGRQE